MQRNLGRAGSVSGALSAVDIAIGVAAARSAHLPPARSPGRVRERVDVPGSGGCTSGDDDRLNPADHLTDRVEHRRTPRVTTEIGEAWRHRTARDLGRVRLTRGAEGDGTELPVDATRDYAIGPPHRLTGPLRDFGVIWFEEPASGDDPAGLAQRRGLGGPDIAAGELAAARRRGAGRRARHGDDPPRFTRGAPAVNGPQTNATRCDGYPSEWRRVAALATAADREVSTPTPAVRAAAGFRHLEWFAGLDRIDCELFDRALDPTRGTVTPVRTETGHELNLRTAAEDAL